MRRAELQLTTSLYWRKTWTLASRGTAIDARLTDPCRVTALGIDATAFMQSIANGQVARLRAQVDSALPALASLRAPAESLWHSLQDALPLDTMGTAWLVAAPEQVAVAPLSGAGENVTTAIVVTARPRVVLGARPVVVGSALPELALTRPEQVAAGLSIPVQIELPFADVSVLVSALLRDQTANDRIRVTGARVWGVADTAVVQVDVTGRARGSLYLVGRVAYDDSARTVLIKDLRYTVASAGVLTRVAARLGAPLVKRAIDQATGRGRLDVGARLDSVRAQLTRQLNGPLGTGARSEGEITNVRILGLYTGATGWVLQVVLEGRAQLVVE